MTEINQMDRQALAELIQQNSENPDPGILRQADQIRRTFYGKAVYLRGLIEFTNYCRNDCYYCGIRRSASQVRRYRLTEEEILSCCETGYALGYRTFVLQGGEDPHYTDDKICSIVQNIKSRWPDCAVTLSIGEKARESYVRFHQAGADRYLLRHETADACHYEHLHPGELSLTERKACLYTLKEIGFQVGAGFMVGSPGQTFETLAEDLLFLKELCPHMVGIGPFIPAAGTPFGDEEPGTLEQTLLMVALTRILLPEALLPATTALGTIHPQGREMALKAGANVVMPNLSPVSVRKDYALYDQKICTGEEAAECRPCIERRIQSAGYEVKLGRGDHAGLQRGSLSLSQAF